MSRVVWFRIVGWNIKSPTLSGFWPGWTIRRSRVTKKIAELKPDVWCGIEMGTKLHVAWVRRSLRLLGWPMTVAKGGKNWRYILFNASRFEQLDGGQVRLGGAYQGDVKEMTWALLRDKRSGRRILVFCAHLEVDGPESYRILQGRSMLSYIESIKASKAMSWDDCYLYVDCNSDGHVQRLLHASRLGNLEVTTKQDRAVFNTNNRWSKLRRRAKNNESIDWLGAGDKVRAGKTFSPATPDASDHNPVGADILE